MSPERLEVWKDAAGEWRYHRKAANGKITDPSQGYSTERAAVEAAREDKPTLPVYVLNADEKADVRPSREELDEHDNPDG